MERRPLKSLIREVLEVNGCLVEENEDRLEVVLPQETARRLGFSEHQVLYFSPQEGRDGEFISYNSEALENISQLIEDKGYFCEGHLPRLYLKKERLDELISRKLSLANAVLRSSLVKESPVSHLIFNFKYSAVSEEKKEGIIPAVINELTLAAPGEMINALARGYYGESSEERWEVEGRRPLEEVFKVATRTAEYEIRRHVSDFERSLSRRLNKDVARLKEYYGTLKEEVRERIRKRNLEGEEKERELSKMRAIDLELERKIREQQNRYSVTINVELLNAMRITMPASVVTLRLRRKDKERELDVVWNPLLKDLELPVCKGCFKSLTVLYLCDEKLHNICHWCHECPSCHRSVCRACHSQACPKCGARV